MADMALPQDDPQVRARWAGFAWTEANASGHALDTTAVLGDRRGVRGVRPMRWLVAVAAFTSMSGPAHASVPALPCTSNQAMVTALSSAINKSDLSGADKFLSPTIVYGAGSFKGKQQVAFAFAKTRWEGPKARLVLATSETLYFQRRAIGFSDQLVSFSCTGQDFDAQVVAVNMHLRNEWIEEVVKPKSADADARDGAK